jgi:hypothetical protein
VILRRILNHYVDAAHITTSENTLDHLQLRATFSSFFVKKLKIVAARSGFSRA